MSKSLNFVTGVCKRGVRSTRIDFEPFWGPNSPLDRGDPKRRVLRDSEGSNLYLSIRQIRIESMHREEANRFSIHYSRFWLSQSMIQIPWFVLIWDKDSWNWFSELFSTSIILRWNFISSANKDCEKPGSIFESSKSPISIRRYENRTVRRKKSSRNRARNGLNSCIARGPNSMVCRASERL